VTDDSAGAGSYYAAIDSAAAAFCFSVADSAAVDFTAAVSYFSADDSAFDDSATPVLNFRLLLPTLQLLVLGV
jgi:hypothetical protein